MHSQVGLCGVRVVSAVRLCFGVPSSVRFTLMGALAVRAAARVVTRVAACSILNLRVSEARCIPQTASLHRLPRCDRQSR